MTQNENWEESAWYASTSTTQTTKTWARQVPRGEKAPPAFASSEAFASADYRVYLPEDSSVRIGRPESALCLSPRGLTVLVSRPEGLAQMDFAFPEVMWIEEGTVLLYGWMAFRDQAKSHYFFFNEANRPLIMPFINSLRARAFTLEEAASPPLPESPTPILGLEKRDFALMKTCNAALGPDFGLEAFYFQESLDELGPFAVMVGKRELIFCRHILKTANLTKLEGRCCVYVPSPALGSCPMVRRERRDVLSLPLLAEGTSGTFSFSKTGLELGAFMKVLGARLSIVG